MPDAPRSAVRSRTLFFALALVPAIAHLACFAYALALRLRYPMDLEWLEGQQLCEAFRFAHGLPVYGPPSQGFVPSPYPPLYHLLVAAIGRCFGLDYWTGRVVSDVSIAVVVAVVTVVIARAAPSRAMARVLAVLGAGAIAASYRPLEASVDLARVDTMGIALVVLAASLATRHAMGPVRAVLVGVLLCAAVYTKQTNVFYVVWILGALAHRDLRGAVLAGAVACALAVPPLVVLQRSSNGWFWTWMMTMRSHPIIPARCAAWGALVVTGGIALGAVLRGFQRRGWLTDATRFWAGMLAASVPACIAPMLSGGGWVNNLVGITWIGLLLGLLMICDALRRTSAEGTVVAALSAMLLGALYDPTIHVPDGARTRDVEALHATVRSLDGDVMTPMYPFVAVRDGKSPAQQMSLVAYADTVHPGDVNADAATAIRGAHARWIILFGHAQEDLIPGWLGPEYVGEPLDLHVQALQETTGRKMMLYRRT